MIWLLAAGAAQAQAPAADTLAAPAAAPSVAAPPPAAAAPVQTSTGQEPTRVYYGGAVGFSFWDDFLRLSVEPLVGYKLTPKLSVGGKLRYEYINDDRSAIEYDSHNFGGSVFSRYRLIPQLYAHAEFAYMSYDYPIERKEVPFLLVGGGYSQPMGPNAWLNAEVLVDVLQDDNSPYEDWEPILSVGVGVGF
jgi:hypothetical protein